MKSPTIFDHASITSVSRRRSRNPRRCISFGISSDGDCQRSGCSFRSGNRRHSAMTAARREAFIDCSASLRINLNGSFAKGDLRLAHSTPQNSKLRQVIDERDAEH